MGLADEAAWDHAATILPPTASSAGGALAADIVPMTAMADHLADWSALHSCAIEENIFLEPGFAVPLFATDAAARHWRMLLVWADAGAGVRPRLVGLLPIRHPRLGRLARGGLVVGVRDPMMTCGTPLLDRDRAAEVFAEMLRHLARPPIRAAGLMLTQVPSEGPFARMLAAEAGCRIVALDGYRRAVLRRSGGNVLSLASAKTRKERKRQRRRLCEQGECAYVSARTPEAVRRATERFLVLERRGWKGTRGTALLVDARLAAFTRAMTAAMAAVGKCRIDALEMDGAAIAMGIVLTAGGRAHFWKTAFDEDHAQLSPGVQFAIDLAERQLADDTVAMTDSCAIPNHPMIDRLWPERIGIVDIVVSVGPRGSTALSLAVASERIRRRVRAAAKARVNGCRILLERFRGRLSHPPSDR